jgi:hypothetical protein
MDAAVGTTNHTARAGQLRERLVALEDGIKSGLRNLSPVPY